MQTSYILKKVIRAIFVLLTVIIVTAALGGSLPVAAKADDTWLLPETLSAGHAHTCRAMARLPVGDIIQMVNQARLPAPLLNSVQVTITTAPSNPMASPYAGVVIVKVSY